jgi:hypothetical protein
VDQRKTIDTQTSYDKVAEEYVQRIFDELQHKPLDRELLDRLIVDVQGLGPICDLGCGPGHVARYLHERGADVVGVDLSPGMVEQARRLNPGIPFQPSTSRTTPGEESPRSIPSSTSRERKSSPRCLSSSECFGLEGYCCWPSTLERRSSTWMNGGDSVCHSTSLSSSLPR